MLPVTDAFAFDYSGTDIHYGRGVTDQLAAVLADHGLERALVVCGSNVGANPAVMDPIRQGLGDRLVGVFDETTPSKTAETVFAGIETIRRESADVLVGLGGGSSLDIARQMSAFAADDRSLSALREAAHAGDLAPPSGGRTDVVAIPTTFAGADVSSGGSVEVLDAESSPTDQPIRTGGSVMPVAVMYDPALFETTPMGALRGSAMNGFDKGIETIYAPGATPVTDATAVHGLRLMRSGLRRLDDSAAMDRAVVGTFLVQFQRRTSIVHAFGHGFSYRYDIQQGLVHAVMVPHVLQYLFEAVDAHRELLASGLGIDTASLSDDGVGEAVVDAVAALRDSLELPTRLRDLDPVREADLPAIARFVHEDSAMDRLPAGVDPSVEDLEGILRAAW